MKRRLYLVFTSYLLTAISLMLTVSVRASDACAGITAENLTPDANCLAWMEAFPGPLVQEIPLDTETLNAYNFWRVGPQTVNLYDAPGGNVAGQIPEGFNFVRAVDTSVEGWIKTAGGTWLLSSEARPAQPSHFRGVLLSDEVDYPFAWVVDKTGIYTSEYPGGPSSEATGRIPLRYERVNIFAEAVGADGWTWYMIGPNQWVNQRFLALVKLVARPEGVQGRWVAVDLYEQTLVAYEDDTPVFATLVSTGLPGWDTNEGIFTVWARVRVGNQSGAPAHQTAMRWRACPGFSILTAILAFMGRTGTMTSATDAVMAV